MKVEAYTQTPAEPVEGTPGVTIRWVITQKDGAPNFAMRVIEVEPGASTPHHTHDYEHEVFVLAGRGAVRGQEGDRPIEAGTVVYVPPNEKHQFVNTGPEALRFICVIPNPV
ncbi:MAG: cupin domain-containing protein [Chloroflexi bacterium]|nr:MAG: cupin domain-containing protein [Chloroflexota bacterium]